MPLKDLDIRALTAKDKIYKRTDERGLYLEVHPSGSKLWRYKYSHLGKDKRIALGRYPEVGLAEARQKRDEARQKLHDGVDPVSERKSEKLVAIYNAANTFGDVAKEYIDKMVAEGRADATTTKANWLLEQLTPIAGSSVSELKPVEVLAALKRVEAKGKYETARRCRSFASRVFRYAVATGRAETDPTSVLRGALITPKAKHQYRNPNIRLRLTRSGHEWDLTSSERNRWRGRSWCLLPLLTIANVSGPLSFLETGPSPLCRAPMGRARRHRCRTHAICSGAPNSATRRSISSNGRRA